MTAVAADRAPLLDRAVDAVGDLRALDVMRLLFGIIVIRHLWPELGDERLAVERFHEPWWSWLPVPSPGLYLALVWVGVAAGAAMLVRPVARVATVVALFVVSYLLFLDLTSFAHNRGFLVWMLVGLSLLPTRPARAAGHLWPVFLLRIVVSGVYLTSGGTKLLDADWRGGVVLRDRFLRHADDIPFDGRVAEALMSRAFHLVLSPTAIAIELFLAIGLWFPRTRLAAIWVAVMFHGTIEVTASVQTFSYSALAALLIWVTPSTRDRKLTAAGPLADLVGRLDWLRRFDVSRATDRAAAPALVDRDGTRRTGRDATLTTLSRLPLVFPFVAPLLARHRFLRWRHGHSRRTSRRARQRA